MRILFISMCLLLISCQKKEILKLEVLDNIFLDVGISKDGKYLALTNSAITDERSMLGIYEPATKKVIQRVMVEKYKTNMVSFSDTEGIIAYSLSNNEIIIYDFLKDKKLDTIQMSFPSKKIGITSIEFNKDNSKLFITASGDININEAAYVYDLKRKIFDEQIIIPGEPIMSARKSENQIVLDYDKGVKIIDMNTRETIFYFQVRNREYNSVHSMDFDAKKKIIVIRQTGSKLVLLNYNSEEICNFSDPKVRIDEVLLSPSGNYIYASEFDGYLNILNQSDCKLISRHKIYKGDIRRMRTDSSGKYIVTISNIFEPLYLFDVSKLLSMKSDP